MKKTIKRILAFALTSVLTVSLFAGCGTTGTVDDSDTSSDSNSAESTAATSDSVLNVAVASESSSFDPAISIGDANMYIFGLIYESLTRFGEDQNIVDGLAESVEHNEDYTQWTYHLRDSAWSNGEPVTADDWVYGITRLLDGSTEVAYPDFNYEIKNAREIFAGELDASELGVTAVDEKTVQFDLAYPVPYFDKLLTHCQHFGINRSFVESIGGDDNYGTSADTVLADGPYYVDSWEKDNIVVLKKNPYYWNKDNIAIEQINVYVIPDESTQTNMFLNGELDIVDISAQRVSAIESAGYEILSYNNGRSAYLRYNMSNTYLSNKYIRQAISCVIDRESIVDNVLKNGSTVADGFVPVGLSGADSTFRELVGSTLTYTYDLDRAQELLAKGLDELGVSAGDITFTLLAKNTDEFTSVAGALQQLLQEGLGVKVNVETLDSSSVTTKVKAYDFDVVLLSWGADFDDATNFLGSYEHDADSNPALYISEEFNETYKNAVYTTDQTERILGLGEAEKILLEDEAITPLYYTAQYYAVSDRVKGVIRRAVVPYLDTYFATIE